MTAKKTGLGKGLDSLIPKQSPEKSDKKDPEVTSLKLTMLEPNREQPRKQFDEDSLIELADSIRQFGVLQPLLVQKKNEYYEIIAGERRWRAAKMAGLKEVPVVIRDLTEQQSVELSLIENIQREDLNPMEEAAAYKRLLTEFNLKQDEVAERVSKSRTAVTNSMRLLKLDKRVQQMVADEMITPGHARALLAIDDPELQFQAAQRVFDEKMSVRDVERLVKTLSRKEDYKKEPEQAENLIYRDFEEKMKALLGTKVSINNRKNNHGKIVIDYYSGEDLERILLLLQSIPEQNV